MGWELSVSAHVEIPSASTPNPPPQSCSPSILWSACAYIVLGIVPAQAQHLALGRGEIHEVHKDPLPGLPGSLRVPGQGPFSVWKLDKKMRNPWMKRTRLQTQRRNDKEGGGKPNLATDLWGGLGVFIPASLSERGPAPGKQEKNGEIRMKKYVDTDLRNQKWTQWQETNLLIALIDQLPRNHRHHSQEYQPGLFIW